MKARLKAYGWNVLIGADQMLNVILAGYPDETISARVYRKALAGQWFWRGLRRLIDLVFFWDCLRDENGIKIKGHCRLSAENELRRVHSPDEMRVH